MTRSSLLVVAASRGALNRRRHRRKMDSELVEIRELMGLLIEQLEMLNAELRAVNQALQELRPRSPVTSS